MVKVKLMHLPAPSYQRKLYNIPIMFQAVSQKKT